jgi:hypothetical protein
MVDASISRDISSSPWYQHPRESPEKYLLGLLLRLGTILMLR